MASEPWLTGAAQVALPATVATIMSCPARTPTRGLDRLLRQPRLLAAAFICQLALLPLIAFGIARVLALSPPLASGLMLTSA